MYRQNLKSLSQHKIQCETLQDWILGGNIENFIGLTVFGSNNHETLPVSIFPSRFELGWLYITKTLRRKMKNDWLLSWQKQLTNASRKKEEEKKNFPKQIFLVKAW